jgi:DNA polymerase I-like protein with 3'-5' exonuclease and polymerase domains
MKTASVLIDERLRKGGYNDVRKIGDIHDEIQFETPVGQEREVGELCVQGIRDAGESLNFRVPLDGNYAIGKSWAATH